MTAPRKDLVPRTEITPTEIVSPTAGRLSASDLERMDHVPEEIMDAARKGAEIHIHVGSDRPEGRGEDLLRRFVPYFVLGGLILVLLGGLALIMAMLLPMIIAAIGALVSIVISLVVTVIAGVVIAVGIGYLQTINAKQPRGKIGKR